MLKFLGQEKVSVLREAFMCERIDLTFKLSTQIRSEPTTYKPDHPLVPCKAMDVDQDGQVSYAEPLGRWIQKQRHLAAPKQKALAWVRLERTVFLTQIVPFSGPTFACRRLYISAAGRPIENDFHGPTGILNSSC